ncbi:unnamed protein product [Rhizoctonia solani]|uniref:Intradiol ring-cleavage dioxygenases domain-containing protein n=1 Tax=Rhizoctonia solani TaxID=456999 RepID=A0A8H3CQL1_9AGAM|nr:unnamed protein product [Rhizoctonia solani]
MDTRTCTPLQNALVEIWACNATGAYSGFTTPPTRGNSMSDQYTGRAIHIHSMVQTNYQVDTNGSIVSHAGQVRHMGQIYFDEGLNDQVLAHSAYQGTSQRRTRNAQDGILSAGSGNGYNAIASTSFLGNSGDVNGGILAYITLGVDTSFQGSINSNNYVTSVTNPAAPTGVSSQGSNGASTTSAAWGSLLLITGNFMMQIMGF